MPYYPEKKPEVSGEERKQTRMTEKRIRLFRLFAAILSCLLILYGSVHLILYYTDLDASRNTARELLQIHNQEEPESESVLQTSEPTALLSMLPTAVPESPMPTETLQPEKDGGRLQPLTYPGNPDLKISERFRNLRKKASILLAGLRSGGGSRRPEG